MEISFTNNYIYLKLHLFIILHTSKPLEMKNILAFLLLCMISLAASAKGKRAFIFYYDQKNGLYDYLITKGDGKWEEMYALKNRPRYHYKAVSEQGNEVTLYDEERKQYVRLTATQYFSGESKDNITQKVHDGYWSEDCNGKPAEHYIKAKQQVFFYEKKECRGFFTTGKDNKWLEYTYDDGILLNTYSVAEKKEDYLLLSNNRGGYYMQVSAAGVYYNAANSPKGFIENYTGHWVKENVSEKVVKTGKDIHKNMAFAFYLKPTDENYHSIYRPAGGNDWEEVRIKDRVVRFKYQLVQESPDEVVLFDPTRTVYVRLTEDESYWGNSRNDINNKIYNGNWISCEDGLSLMEVMAADINVFAYQSDERDGYFIRFNDGFWFEYNVYGGYPRYTLTTIEETGTYVLLYCSRCEMYFKLTKDTLLKSKTRMGNYEEKAKGKWTEGKVQKGPLPEKKEEGK